MWHEEVWVYVGGGFSTTFPLDPIERLNIGWAYTANSWSVPQDPGFDSRRGCAVFFSSDPAVSSSIFVGAEREEFDYWSGVLCSTHSRKHDLPSPLLFFFSFRSHPFRFSQASAEAVQKKKNDRNTSARSFATNRTTLRASVSWRLSPWLRTTGACMAIKILSFQNDQASCLWIWPNHTPDKVVRAMVLEEYQAVQEQRKETKGTGYMSKWVYKVNQRPFLFKIRYTTLHLAQSTINTWDKPKTTPQTRKASNKTQATKRTHETRRIWNGKKKEYTGVKVTAKPRLPGIWRVQRCKRMRRTCSKSEPTFAVTRRTPSDSSISVVRDIFPCCQTVRSCSTPIDSRPNAVLGKYKKGSAVQSWTWSGSQLLHFDQAKQSIFHFRLVKVIKAHPAWLSLEIWSFQRRKKSTTGRVAGFGEQQSTSSGRDQLDRWSTPSHVYVRRMTSKCNFKFQNTTAPAQVHHHASYWHRSYK